jgi:hypothetical protein
MAPESAASLATARHSTSGSQALLRVVNWALPLCAAAGLLAFHAACFFESWTDENIHLYVAGRLAQGAVLYRDLQSTRPPLALLPLSTLIRLGLSPLFAARATVVLSVLACALLLFWAGRRFFGAFAGAAACSLFLLSPELFARHTFTGIQQVALTGALCVVLGLAGSPLLSGIAAGLSLGCGQHAAVLLLGTALLIGVRRPRELLRFAAGALCALAAVFGLAAAQAGTHAIWQDLIARHLYHLGAASMPDDGQLRWYLVNAGLENLPLLVLAAAAWLVPQAAPQPQGALARRALTLLVLAHLAAVMLMSGGLILYVFPALPLLALLAGDGLVRAARWSLQAPRRPVRWLLAALALLCLTLGGFALARGRYQRRDHTGYPLLPQLRQLAMARLQRLSVAGAIAGTISPQLLPGQTLFGYATIVTAVAVDAGRRISGEEADLAPRWIQQGSVTRREILDAVEADHPGFFITPHSFYEQDPFFRDYLARCYEPPQRFPRVKGDGSGIPEIDVFHHRAGITCRSK